MHVIATAGHVDHGKSALLRALTGMEPDRWAEERRRGMTIDLGYVWMRLPSRQQLAFVDVPGHARFVPNMLAGVGQVPAVLFVVAADGGWMPQSAEHLAAIDALGISHGLLAVTRSDLADPAPAMAQAQEAIAKTSLRGVPAVAVSAVTGRGIGDLVTALGQLADQLPHPDPGSPVRIWVDRAFSITGAGTVLTGTLPAGTVSRGDELLLTPALRPVRVRGLQTLGDEEDHVTGVARIALNVRGVDAHQAGRGMALVRPGQWTLTKTIDVRLTPGSFEGSSPRASTSGRDAAWTDERGSASDGGRREGGILSTPTAGGSGGSSSRASTSGRDAAWTDERSVRGGKAASEAPRHAGGSGGSSPRASTVHCGSARTRARVRMLGADLARLTLADPLPLHVGDRVLLRDPGAAAGTRGLAGAVVLDVVPPPVSRRGAAAEAVAELSSWPDRPTATDLIRRHKLIRLADARAMGVDDLPDEVAPGWLADPGHLAALKSDLAGLVAAHAAEHPLAAGMPIDAARTALGLPDREIIRVIIVPPLKLTAGLITTGRADQPAHATTLPAPLASPVASVLADLAVTPFSAPPAARLGELGLDNKALAAAARHGALLRIADQVVLAPGADVAAGRVLADLPQPFTAAQAREALGTTRRTLIPLLEYLDRQQITRRLPDDRREVR